MGGRWTLIGEVREEADVMGGKEDPSCCCCMRRERKEGLELLLLLLLEDVDSSHLTTPHDPSALDTLQPSASSSSLVTLPHPTYKRKKNLLFSPLLLLRKNTL